MLDQFCIFTCNAKNKAMHWASTSDLPPEKMKALSQLKSIVKILDLCLLLMQIGLRLAWPCMASGTLHTNTLWSSPPAGERERAWTLNGGRVCVGGQRVPHLIPVPRNCSPFEKASALTQPWCPEISVEYILSQDWSCWSKYDFLCRNGILELLTRARSRPSAWIIPLGRVPVFLAVCLPRPSGMGVFLE